MTPHIHDVAARVREAAGDRRRFIVALAGERLSCTLT